MSIRSLAMACAAGAALAGPFAPVAAKVTRATDNSFVSRHEVVVKAAPQQVWLTLITPSGWWRSEHTWSGESKNLTLTPQAGGCFCETIPEVDEPGRFTLQGSVEHMRVIQAYPEQALRMVGSLGPLQSEPVTGVLTIAISKVDEGTRIVFEYNVGGAMRYEIPVISQAVDAVIGVQAEALATQLGPVAIPVPKASPTMPAPAPAPPPAPLAPEAPRPRPAPAPASEARALPPREPAPEPAPKSPSVEEVFSDLQGNLPR